MSVAPGRAACALACALAGALLVLAFPPFDLWPLAAVAPAVPCWVAAGPARRRADVLLAGLLFGAAFFLGTVYWIVGVMSRYGGLAAPVASGVLLLLVAYLALFPAVFMLTVRRAAGRFGPHAALAAAPAVWTALELLRNYLFSGFPWARLGTALHASPSLRQSAALAGVYGLSALLMLPASALAALALPGRRSRPGPLLYAGTAAAALGLAAVWGGARLDRLASPGGATWKVGLVQGNVPQDLKWDAAEASRNLERHLTLSRRAFDAGADLVVWPESSLPYDLRTHAAFARPVRELARRAGRPLLLGSLDRRGGKTFNSAFLLDGDGDLQGTYDKTHLVPFGEYVPLRGLLFFVGSLVQEVGDLSRGRPGDPLGGGVEVPPLGTVICYEIVFPELTRRSVRAGAQLLVNLTNDAWFGRTSAPYQHFSEAVLRSVETGRWTVRAANTGISGIIDPAGRVRSRSRLGEATFLTGEIQARTELTPYVRSGDAFAWACAMIAASTLLLRGRRPESEAVVISTPPGGSPE